MPFGKMPVLEVDGRKIPQSSAIARYLAKQFGYAGKTALDEAWVDALVDQYKDYLIEIRPALAAYAGFSDDDKEKLTNEVAEPARDKFYSIIEKQLTTTGTGFLVGDSLTWADLVIADHVETIEGFWPGFLAAFPKVVEHRKKVQSTPKLKEWIEKRKKTNI